MATRRHTKESEKFFILGLVAIFIVLSLIVIKDIVSVIVFSFILAYFLFPIHKFYLKRVNSDRISALMTLFTATVFIFLPFALLSYFLILSLINILIQYRIYIENPEILNGVLSDFFENLTASTVLSGVNFSELFNTMVIWVLDFARSFFSSIPKFLVYFIIMLFISYYVLTYNKKLLSTFNEHLPLGLRKQNEILNNIQKNLRVLFKGYFFTGIVQTAVAVVGYILFGAPNILIISFLTLVVSLVPYLGTPLIWVPVSFYMIITGDQFNGIALLIYGTLIISMIDNFIRPVLMSDKDTISPPLVFVGFIGGLLAFGIPGIILGPIIISITLILLKYIKEYYEVPESA